MIYEKSVIPVNKVGSRVGASLGRAKGIGHKGSVAALGVGQRLRSFYDKYGAHVPGLAEYGRKAEPYLEKAEQVAKELEAALRPRQSLEKKKKKKSKEQFSTQPVHAKPSGGSRTRPSLHKKEAVRRK